MLKKKMGSSSLIPIETFSSSLKFIRGHFCTSEILTASPLNIFRVSTKLSWDKNIKKGIFLNTLNVRISGPVS